mmetsp:Transcript_10060/g.32328  ORF Transcript_10060/g.32328 Transcript_10060/m.32328 type:complete len:352 (-) Transcript_10060:57-1112(-)
MLLDDLSQARDAEVLEIVVLRGEEARDRLGRLVQENRVWVYRGDGADALVDNGVAGVDAGVGAAHDVREDLVRALRRPLVGPAQVREDPEETQLGPRRRDAMVVKVARQPMLDDLLQDGDKGRHELLELGGVVGYHVVQQTERGAHDRGVLVAQGAPHRVPEVRDRRLVQLIEPVQDHGDFFSDQLLAVRAELDHAVHERRDHVARRQAQRRRQGRRHLQVVRARHVLLQLVHEHEAELVRRRQAQPGAQVPHALLHQVLRRRELDRLDVPEARVVTQHLHVHQSNQKLLHLLLRHVRLHHPLLQSRHLLHDDAVLLLLRLGLPDRLHQVEEVLRQVAPGHHLSFLRLEEE